MRRFRHVLASCVMVLMSVSMMITFTNTFADTATNTSLNITPIKDVQRATMVTVQGTVQRILDTDEFRLMDATGDIKVYIGYKNVVPVKQSEKVTVTGFVDRGVFKEIYAREIIHEDGRTTEFNLN